MITYKYYLSLWSVFSHCTNVSANFLYITRKDVGNECRYDMWPSIQLPFVSGAGSKLELTVS